MKNKKNKTIEPMWNEEKKQGWEKMLTNRLKFHRGLSLRMIATCAGVSETVARRHCQKLIEKGKARWFAEDLKTHLLYVD